MDRRLPITFGPLAQFPDDPLVCMRSLHAEHGDIAALEEDGQRILFVFSPEYNQRVQCDNRTFHSRFFAIRGPRGSSQRRLSSGLLTMNGDDHKTHRRMVMGPFQKTVIPQYHEAVIRMAGDMLDDWQPRAVPPRGWTTDVNQEMTQYMLRTTSALIFGVDVPEMACRIGQMIDHWVEMNNDVGIGAFISDQAIMGKYDELLAHAEELEVEVRGLIQHRRSTQGAALGTLGAGELASGARSSTQGAQSRTLGASAASRDVLSLLIQACDEQGAISEDQLVGHVALMFGAAHLTTAHTFTWTLFLLAQHPSVLRRVMDEIDREMPGDAPTYDDMSRMPLTDRVLKESMRLLPASCYLHRNAIEPTQLGPFDVARGTPVIFSQFMTHHRPDLYDDPEAFQPDRWLSIAPSPYEYLPFGSGPRMCLGAGMAAMILRTALPMMLKRYRMSMVPGTVVNGKMISTMLGPTTPVMMQIVPQDGRFQSQPVSGNIHTMVDLREMSRASAVEQRKAA
jgi:cytochrome P450